MPALYMGDTNRPVGITMYSADKLWPENMDTLLAKYSRKNGLATYSQNKTLSPVRARTMADIF